MPAEAVQEGIPAEDVPTGEISLLHLISLPAPVFDSSIDG